MLSCLINGVLLLALCLILNSQFSNCIILKWIYPDVGNIELVQNLSSKADTCRWFKLEENREIDMSGRAFGDVFIHKGTSQLCNLIVKNSDKNQIYTLQDFYKPLVLTRDSSLKINTYVLGSYKSFILNKTTINSTHLKFFCELKISLPDPVDKNLSKELYNVLNTLVQFNAFQLPIKSNKARRSGISNIRFGRSLNTDLIVNHIAEATIIVDKKNSMNKNNVVCEMKLLDGASKAVVYKQTLNQSVLDPLTTSVRIKNQFLNAIFYLFFFIFRQQQKR